MEERGKERLVERDKCREAALQRLQDQASSSSPVIGSNTTSGIQLEGHDQNGISEPFATFGPGKSAEAGGRNTDKGDIIDLEEDLDCMQINGVHGGWGGIEKNGGVVVESNIPSSNGDKDRHCRGQAVSCPVCNQSWNNMSNLELNQHIDACLSDDIEVLA